CLSVAMEPDAYVEMEQLQDRHWWFRARRRILSDQLARLGLGGQARVLEIGSGPGGNLQMLSRFGHVSAVEMNEQARALAARRCQVDRATDFNSLLFPLAVAARLRDRLGRGKASSGTSLPPGPVGALLEAVFSSERLWLRRFGFPCGLSLMALAR